MKDLQYYQRLPYTRHSTIEVEGTDRYWIAWIEELPGCKADGDTEAEAMRNLAEAFDDYIVSMLAWKTPIPEPARIPATGLSAPVPARRTTVVVRAAAPPIPRTVSQIVMVTRPGALEKASLKTTNPGDKVELRAELVSEVAA